VDLGVGVASLMGNHRLKRDLLDFFQQQGRPCQRSPEQARHFI